MTALSTGLRPVPLALVALGGAAGTLCRAGLTQLVPAAGAFHWPTLGANLTGAFLLGALLEGLLRAGAETPRRRNLRMLCGTGFLGGFTTFSTLAVELLGGLTSGAVAAVGAYAVISVLGGVLAAWLGIAVATLGRRRCPEPPAGRAGASPGGPAGTAAS